MINSATSSWGWVSAKSKMSGQQGTSKIQTIGHCNSPLWSHSDFNRLISTVNTCRLPSHRVGLATPCTIILLAVQTQPVCKNWALPDKA